MTRVLPSLLVFVMSYLIGCFNPAYLIGRIRGIDIREYGSGNAGATNLGNKLGRKAGFTVAAIDVFKTVFAISLAGRLFPAVKYAAQIAGTGCVVGHVFPFQMHFKGGKGLACMAGILFAYHPLVLVAAFFIELVPTLIIGYGVVFSILTAVMIPLSYVLITHQVVGALIYSVASVIIIWKHIPNLKKIQAGEEKKISSIWTK